MSKKGFIKGMVFGIIICTMLSISVTVFAKSISKQISVIFNSVKVYNDTKLMEFKDAKGNNVGLRKQAYLNYIRCRYY